LLFRNERLLLQRVTSASKQERKKEQGREGEEGAALYNPGEGFAVFSLGWQNDQTVLSLPSNMAFSLVPGPLFLLASVAFKESALVSLR
jgi:hypothetical protein